MDRSGPSAGEGGSVLGRRQFLAAVAGAGAAGAMVALGAGRAGATVRKAAAVMAAGSDLGAVEHIVLLMQENRSFDHYFGTLAGVRGFDDHPKGKLGPFAQAWPANTTKRPRGVLLPYHLDTSNGTDAECTYDLTHSWGPQHQCWDDGSVAKFVETHTLAANEGPVHGLLTMGYYTRSDLPFYYALADAFTICDGYHCSVMGPTNPNRLYWMTGTIDPAGTAGGPVLVTDESASIKGSLSWTTMPEVLDDAGISWKVYNPEGSEYVPDNSLSSLVSNNILQMFAQYMKPSSTLWEKAFLSTFPTTFAADVRAGTLPQVSWLVAPTIPQDMSEHPPAPPARGEYYTHSVLDTLTSNPALWAKTILILSYDENDGFFDHVAPPTAPRGTKDEWVTVSPLPAAAQGIDGPIGLGFRVPSLVISPFSRGGHVVSETLDHTSQLRLIEERFGVRVPNLSAWRRSHVGDFTSALRPQHPDTTVPSLPATPLTPEALTEECATSQLIELNVDSAQYPIPRVQRMPTQER